MNILVPNLGSTSLKYQILEMPGEQTLARGRYERVSDYRTAIAGIQAGETRVDAVAFKAVHGGPSFRGTFVIDDAVVAAQQEFLLAAPLHNRIYIDAIAAFRDAMPGVPLVAAFETEFHKTMPDSARWYGVPSNWRTDYGIERYGFHGASHQFVAGRAPVISRTTGIRPNRELPSRRQFLHLCDPGRQVRGHHYGLLSRSPAWRTPPATATWTRSPCST